MDIDTVTLGIISFVIGIIILPVPFILLFRKSNQLRSRTAILILIITVAPALIALGAVYGFPDNSQEKFQTEIGIKLTDLTTPQLVNLNQQVADEFARRNLR